MMASPSDLTTRPWASGDASKRAAIVMIETGQPMRGGALSTIELLRNMRRWSPTVFLNEDGALGRGFRAASIPCVILNAGLAPRGSLRAGISGNCLGFRTAW